MKIPSRTWEDGTLLSPSSSSNPACLSTGEAKQYPGNYTNRKGLGIHFRQDAAPAHKTPSAVHFLHLIEGPQTLRLTAAIQHHLHVEISQPVSHFRIDRENTDQGEFLTIGKAFEQRTPDRFATEASIDKKVQLKGTDLSTAHQKILSCILQHIDQFPVILTDLSAETPRSFLRECLRYGHWLYILLGKEEKELCRARRLIKSLPRRIHNMIRPVLITGNKAILNNLHPLEERLGLRISHIIRPGPDKLHLPLGSQYHEDPNGRYAGQARRIAREIGHCRMGLVLSSGGAKGFSYVGVIQVLEKLGLEFDIIAGSSFGAVVGALWARGYDGNQLEDIALRFRNWMHLLKIIDHVVDIRRGLIGGHRMEKYLRTLLEDAHFSELSIPLEITATDIENLHSHLIDSGDVASALHASSAIPGICVPSRRNGHLYIDGGIANPLPVQSLKDRGIERIIAVSTVLTHDQGREMGSQRMAADGDFQKNHPIAHFLNKRLNLFAQGNAFDTLMRSIETAQIRLVERDAQLADLVLQPLPHNSRWQDFTNPQKYVNAGRKTATENVDALLAVEAARRKGAMR